MPLLIDEIRTKYGDPSLLAPAFSDGSGLDIHDQRLNYQDFLQNVQEVQGKSIIRATNIFQWMLRQSGDDSATNDEPECCFAPFPVTWVEWSGLPMANGGDGRIGVMVNSEKNEAGEWMMLMVFVYLEDRGLAQPFWHVMCRLGSDGAWKGVAAINGNGETADPFTVLDDNDCGLYGIITEVVLHTFCFMNCTGVRTILEEPSKTPLQKKWNQKAEKEGKKPKPLVSFTTVEIGKFFAQARNGQAQPTGAHNREHWTRGHVKHYPGLLLFGRVKLEKPGVWCPAFKSGRAKGEVKRAEYNVSTPERSINLEQDAAAA